MKEKGRLGFIIQTWLERVIEISTDLAVHTGSGQFSVHFLFRKLHKLNQFTACFITRCRNEFGPLLPFMEPVQPASLFRGASTQPTHCIVVHTLLTHYPNWSIQTHASTFINGILNAKINPLSISTGFEFLLSDATQLRVDNKLDTDQNRLSSPLFGARLWLIIEGALFFFPSLYNQTTWRGPQALQLSEVLF